MTIHYFKRKLAARRRLWLWPCQWGRRELKYRSSFRSFITHIDSRERHTITSDTVSQTDKDKDKDKDTVALVHLSFLTDRH